MQSGLTFYRSVVFDASGKYVLPGCLRNVYTLGGEYYELFPKSDCVFSNCAFSRNRRKFLTDSSNDPKKVSLWNMEDGAELCCMLLDENVACLAISPDGSVLTAADITGRVYISHCDTLQGWKFKNVPCGLMHLAFDGNYIFAFGSLGFVLAEIGSHISYTWVWNGEHDYQLFSLRSEDQLSSSTGVSSLSFQRGKFLLWPSDSSTLDLTDFYEENAGTCLVQSVSRIFPDLKAGFYTRLSDNSILAGSPSFNYVALVDVSHPDCSFKSPAVNEVMLSPEGDTLYSICSD